MATVWRTKLIQKQRWLAVLFLLVAILSIVDATFVIGCHNQCSAWQQISQRVHDIESTISVTTLLVATIIDALVNKRVFSRLFLAIQAVAGLILISTLLGHQGATFIQYIYQPLGVIWLAYVLHGFMPRSPQLVHSPYIRKIIALLIFIGGLLMLALALHVKPYHQLPVWLDQHGVIVGVTMLYFARQVYQGQRRAAIIIVVALVSQVIKYAIITPHLYPLVFSEFVLAALILNWSEFRRNTGIPPIVLRLKNLFIVFIGIAAAILLLLSTASLTGHKQLFNHPAKHLVINSKASLDRAESQEDRFQDRLSHLRYVSTSLAVTVLALTIWTIFRPAGSSDSHRLLDETNIEELLKRYSNSSEDFFKLWPKDKLYFTIPEIDGFIAYKKASNTVFALADPICDPVNRSKLLDKFIETSRAHGWLVCFILISDGSRDLYTNSGLKTIAIGSSATIPVKSFTESTISDKWWRWQLNRAARTGISYQISYPPHDTSLLKETSKLSDDWLQRAGHKEQGFALGYYSTNYLQNGLLHLLRDSSGGLVAFANQLPSYNDSRQATTDLIRFQPDIKGVMPVLIARFIESLAKDSRFDSFDLGFVPLAKIDTKTASLARRLSASRFSAGGLEQFKDKFKPDWQPQYLAYDGDLIDLTMLISRLEEVMRVQ